MNESDIKEDLVCYHCGEPCPDKSISLNDKLFCCTGCRMVYEILEQNNLCNYYTIDNRPGSSPKDYYLKRFDYLDDERIKNTLLDFRGKDYSFISFYIPQMHCSSCIWLLENLYKLNPGIHSSQVNFPDKRINIRFFHNKISLKEVVIILASIGYEPKIQQDAEKNKQESANKKLLYKIGVAGFCFGNIMLFSFPEYLSIDSKDSFYIALFNSLNIFLSLPALIYSGSEYYLSAWKSLKKKNINIDFPLSLGIFVLFIRSLYEIITGSGAGYLDSMSGLIFLLLIGRFIQNKTYTFLNFERSYKSYFPLSVLVRKSDQEIYTPISELKTGDRILIRNNEIIPADAVLFSNSAHIDYSFVSGEADPVEIHTGDIVYAGGKQLGEIIELEIVREAARSYLTLLWDNEVFKNKPVKHFSEISNTISKYFTFAILAIAFVSAYFWLPDIRTAMNVLTAVLIVACPCALALSIPFTFGNTLRILGNFRFYLKNSNSVEELAKINTIVFDKTGTITEINKAKVSFCGVLNDLEKSLVRSITKNSIHPLSKKIFDHLNSSKISEVQDFIEIPGKGIKAKINNNIIRIGSYGFIMQGENSNIGDSNKDLETRIHVKINNIYKGFFIISNVYRTGIRELLNELKGKYKIILLSGDNDSEKSSLLKIFTDENTLHFNMSPENKLNFIKDLQQDGSKVLMIGDGLNDAGALKQSNFGIAVTEDISSFSPSSDAILDASLIKNLNDFLFISKRNIHIIYFSFLLSSLYNLFGLGFAVNGLLTPILAAVLMPVSSISVVLFAVLSTNYLARKRGLL